MEMEVEKINVTCDHIGLFSGKYRQKKTSQCVLYFYATIKGQVSEAKGGKWSDHISDVMDM